MDPRLISIQDFTYLLPEEKIAYHPLPQRDSSKLLINHGEKIDEDIYRNIASFLPPESLLVFNNTRVIEARLLFQKSSGATIEIFCLEPHESSGDLQKAIQQKEKVWWKCLIGGASKWKKGTILEKNISSDQHTITLNAAIKEKKGDYFVVEFFWSPAGLSFLEILHQAGAIPLPPYIKRKTSAEDAKRYQTVYAIAEGSVAAPTAGLHFTPHIFQTLGENNMQTAFVTLHVGAGTFKPVKAGRMRDHEMHAEFIEVSRATLQLIARRLQKPLIAVGTTSLRTLESIYWMGVKIIEAPDLSPEELVINQWDPYDLRANGTTPTQSVEALLRWMERNHLDDLFSKTSLLIVPGYEFKIIDGLITNFHQPASTLLLLVAALIGDQWKTVYQYALDHSFRFLSYGDGCLLLKPDTAH